MTSPWPRIPFLALRGAQIFFAIIVLGLSAYVGDQLGNYWSPWFCLVTAIFTLLGAGGLLAAFFVAPAFTAPLITIGVDGFLFLFWLISLAGFADQASPVLNLGSCDYFYSNICGSIKGNMAMVVFEFLLFLATLGFSGWLLYRERAGKGGPAGANPEGGFASAGAIAGPPPVATTHGTYPMQQQTPVPVSSPPPQMNSPTPVPYPQEGQYQYPQQTQSPPPPQGYPEMPVPAGPQGYQQQPQQQY
ncbi:hypothetical protein TWF730_004420 [Orbilia blumenaviensis]|uniref:MARVEL domain-containing protein n=1 Tax=Orbilia blumenaviensis TaxID=1796055 RepID=A0AAV9U0W6_9PEZI